MTEYQPGDIQPGSDATPLSRREARKAEAEALKSSTSSTEQPDTTPQPDTAAARSDLDALSESEPPVGGDEPVVAAGEAASARPMKRRTSKKTPRPPVKRSLATKVVGVFGELLITAGVFVLLFLGWQLWWNSIVLTNEQASDATSLADDWKLPVVTGTTPTPTPTSTGAAAAPVNYGEPAVMGAPSAGSDFAILYVPRFGADFKRTIAEGVDPHTVLNKGGAGHYDDTQMPGEVGNFVVAGHRKAYGGAMTLISDLQIGDRVYVQTADGYYTYVFRNITYVLPTQVEVLNPVPQLDGVAPTQRILTLTTCNPLYSTAERSIAYAVYESWQPLSAGPPAEIAASVAAAGG